MANRSKLRSTTVSKCTFCSCDRTGERDNKICMSLNTLHIHANSHCKLVLTAGSLCSYKMTPMYPGIKLIVWEQNHLYSYIDKHPSQCGRPDWQAWDWAEAKPKKAASANEQWKLTNRRCGRNESGIARSSWTDAEHPWWIHCLKIIHSLIQCKTP